MPEVYAWPPVYLIGHEFTRNRPIRRGRGLSGTSKFSQSKPTRRMVTADVTGIGRDMAGSAYVEQLKNFLDEKPPFVRVTPLPAHYFLALQDVPDIRGVVDINWTAGGTALTVNASGTPLATVAGDAITGTAGSDVWPYLDCTGFPASRPVAFPAEAVEVDGQRARVIRLTRSDASGAARLWLDQALPSGNVVIGQRESIAFEIEEFPRAVQTVSGGYSYRFELREIFEEEYADGFTEVNPWT